jgi:hypothetical protein
MLSLCIDCRKAPTTLVLPAIHSFDDHGKPNGSREAVCTTCAASRSQSRRIVQCAYCFEDVIEGEPCTCAHYWPEAVL